MGLEENPLQWAILQVHPAIPTADEPGGSESRTDQPKAPGGRASEEAKPRIWGDASHRNLACLFSYLILYQKHQTGKQTCRIQMAYS